MRPCTENDLERIGRVADQADNYWHASQLPLIGLATHLAALQQGLTAIAQQLKALHADLSTTADWAEMPCDHCRYITPAPPSA